KNKARHIKVKWTGNTRHVPWNALLERVDIIPNSMVATMAAAESGWGTSRLARENNNLFGMKCGAGRCRVAMKGYSQFGSVEQSGQAYGTSRCTS
ncbi:glucosaminidase domain-containing protein, partial [Pseudomonas aeruginosa]|uniref:glucosaminidase domain-containing protein n=1 Tax=Pseudomonas aeruginosa TaxID=287 RepID=UPI0039696D54